MKNENKIKEIVQSSLTYQEVMTKLNYKCKGGGVFRALKQYLKNENIDVSHFKGKGHGTSNTAKKTLEEVLVKQSTYCNIPSLKRRLLKAKILVDKCKICGLTEWLDKKISLHLDHINGENNDHRIKNIRLLCPNCHSQTDTYAGKNNRKR